ncbi:MAG: integrase core domain-containing protein [Oscillospiraceae bacterium]|nr:integrase core domain-containing protein [Oscillospiraceae bacterium]
MGLQPIKPPNPKYIPKLCEQMSYPGQRVQIDVKFVPAVCLVGEVKGEKFYQYTNIKHKLIRPYTSRHNGKVERSHRKDNKCFYAVKRFYSFDDFKKQLAVRNRDYNNFPMRPLNWKSPREILNHFLIFGEVF